jgi:hypothetical protein
LLLAFDVIFSHRRSRADDVSRAVSNR